MVESLSEVETDQIGRAIASVVAPGTVIGLVGSLGAGKTRLVRAVAEALGVAPGAIASPTFVLIHEYDGRLPVYHFDVYRLPGTDEFEGLGPSDYWNGEGLCLVEWADRVAEYLPTGAWMIHIESTGTTTRRFLIELPLDPTTASRLAEHLRHSLDLSI